MLATSAQPEVLDLRHFSAEALRPLLDDEARQWMQRLAWDYSRSVDLLLDYVNTRSLTGYVALKQGRVAGYAFGVCEAAKAVLGDVYAFGETAGTATPVCERLLEHLIETLQATPGITRVESQLLLFRTGALRETYEAAGFRAFPRCFMLCAFEPGNGTAEDAAVSCPGYAIGRWQAEAYLPAAALIQEAYLHHTDSEINDQYRTLPGAQRFLHNIIHFPGCGVFDAPNSWVLRSRESGRLEGVVLCSRVRSDAAHITQLCIRPALRGQGWGSLLLGHCLRALRQSGLRAVSLTVTESNRGAMRLYAREGFQVAERFEAWVWDQNSGRG